MLMILTAVTSFNCVSDVMINLIFLHTFTSTPILKVEVNVKKVNHITITMINMFSRDVFLFTGSNAGGFFFMKNPSSAALHGIDFTQYAYSNDWAGRRG